ncbi:circularly permuted type 2 ATP-grasp protein [Celeribacter sp. ASW11-22]|nr:circularly permuted type 2 ATP-grasp protein [Celeribacter litoreus]
MDILARYQRLPGVADELFDPAGHMRPVWRRFVARFLRLSSDDIRARFERGDQYLRDAGVFYRQYSNDPLAERDWPLSHIPVILHEQEWDQICAGLTQRANLLEQVMADLYGPARLVADGHLPAELIARSEQWLRPMVGVPPRGGHYLHFLAFEIGRSPDGTWFVVGDRTQAPSGAGFALENRMATGRIFPERFPRAHIHKLAGFFGTFRDAMEDLASPSYKRPKVSAILTPGPSNDTYYEHTYIARYLGMMLLEGEDIVVENGEAMVRTIEGLQPLGMLWRRIDATFGDPLEFDENSHIGAPGLMDAVRSGELGLANAFGSGILESRAMMAFLPRVAEVLTGGPLMIPNIATWWCGGEAERAYVRENVENMLIGPADAVNLPFDLDSSTALGGKFMGDAKESISDWLEREGDRLVGQEAVTLSTTPAWEDTEDGGQVVPRPMTVRVFAARTATGWQFMKGGYARIGRSNDATALAMQSGGSVADVWIVADKPLPKVVSRTDEPDNYRRTSPGTLPARAADNLYWLGRYVERTEDAVRLIRAYHLRLAATDNRNDVRLKTLYAYMEGFGFDLNETFPTTLIQRIQATLACASKVRDRFSTDGMLALKDLLKTAKRMQETVQPGDDCARAMSVLIRKMAGISGLVHENMYRSAGWRFLSFGRALERADAVAAVLAEFADPDAPEGSLDLAVEVGDSIITHQRRYRVETSRNAVVDLLALDADNPRGLLFLIRQLGIHGAALPDAERDGRPSDVMKAILPLETELACATPEELTSERILSIRSDLGRISDLLTTVYLR